MGSERAPFRRNGQRSTRGHDEAAQRSAATAHFRNPGDAPSATGCSYAHTVSRGVTISGHYPVTRRPAWRRIELGNGEEGKVMKRGFTAIARNNLWLAAVMLGVFFMGLGAFFIYEGVAAKESVREALIAEQATTAGDAVIPDAPIVDLAAVEAQEDAITAHTLGRLGPYGELERGSDERATYLDGLTLRNSLNMAVVGFKVAELVIGIGAVIIILGTAILLLLAPALHWARQPAAERADAPGHEWRPATAHGPGVAI